MIALSYLAIFMVGVWFGWWIGRVVKLDRPAVTPWGESTALWSETDWDWFESCGRHSDSAWAAETRRAAVERLARMAGTDLDGAIIPPGTLLRRNSDGTVTPTIDRSPKSWWTN